MTSEMDLHQLRQTVVTPGREPNEQQHETCLIEIDRHSRGVPMALEVGIMGVMITTAFERIP